MSNPRSTDSLIALAEVRSMAGRGEARSLRESADLSLAEIAQCVGVAAATIQRWEVGARRPQGAAALRYRGVLRAINDSAGFKNDESHPGGAAFVATGERVTRDVEPV